MLASSKPKAMELDRDGLPIVPLGEAAPGGKLELGMMMRKLVFHTILPILVPMVLATKYILTKSFRETMNELYAVVCGATKKPVTKEPYFQDKELLKQVYQLPSAQPYVQNHGLLYQKSEGFCGPATLQCIWKSYPDQSKDPPPQVPGPSSPEKWQEALLQHTSDEDDYKYTTRIVSGSEGYGKFIETLEQAASSPDTTRIALNYLRPALVGFKWPWFWPMNFCIGLLGGHFSPIIGILPNNNSTNNNNKNDDPYLVAVFDVNHKYGGTYLVPSKVLYSSITAKDIMSQKTRALVVIERCPNKKQQKIQ